MKKNNNSETHIIMFPFQCSFCGSKEQLRTIADSKNSDPELLVSVISFYCSWDLLSVYKTRADCKASMGRVRAAGVSSVRTTSAAACCVSECAVCSFTMLHSQRRCLHPSVSETLQAVKCKTAPPVSSSHLLQIPFFGWTRVNVITLCVSFRI